MASRGRRGGAPAREDEPRRDERAEQQAPTPQSHVLPPPPPMDYGVFMQGLVQAMQTQAHTQAALQAQLEAQQAQVPAQDHGGPSTMERFKRILPPSFKGESDPLLAESWMREIEKIFRAIRCADNDKVTLATYMLQEGEMEQYLEEKKASQKRPAATFQRQDKKKVVYQTPQRSVAVGSSQVPSVRSPGVKKECPHYGKTHGGTECWMITGKCFGRSDHKIKDCPRLQQGVQRGAPAPVVAAATPATGRPGRPRAPARVFALAREDAEQAEHVTEGTASTPWTPILSPASSDVDANCSDLHALQSPEFREQASSPIGELSPTASIRRSKASSGVLLQLEARGNQGEGFPTTGLAPASTKNPEEWCFGGFLRQPKESFTKLLIPSECT
ncbi:hypothetical protein Taro_027804 [Colocasia esculenta]|uniref:Uncharacterized protein n=1 Tax=Colocasia esculenta TaxID=4460 RepID=A0A843VEU6_COLES|nr:hypothetical protein [Colocasia esculenta]